METIVQYLNDYFKDRSIYIETWNNQYIRFGCRDTKIYFKLTWEEIFDILNFDEPNINDNFNDFVDYLNSNGEDNRIALIDNIFSTLSQENLYCDSNKGLTLWSNKMNSFINRWILGFYKDGYAEFLIEKSNAINMAKVLTHFFIGNVEISISPPSDPYILFFQSVGIGGWIYFEWEDRLTIKIRKRNSKIKKDEIECYLQQTLFILNVFYPKHLTFGSGSDPRYHRPIHNTKKLDFNEFPMIKHIEPIIYFNEGISSTDETSFYYFYKVLEFYFNINKTEIISDKIKGFLNEGEFSNESVEKLAFEITNIDKPNKETSLKQLLNNRYICAEVKEVLKVYFGESDGSHINNCAKKLYNYRNNVVHSEDETRRLPSLLNDYSSQNDLAINDWNDLAKELSLICINHFGYSDRMPYLVDPH